MPGYNLQQLLDDGTEAMRDMARAQIGPSGDAEIAAGHNCASVLRQFMEYELTRPNAAAPPGATLSRRQVEQAANRAADLIRSDSRVFRYENSRTIAAQTLMDLLINATLTLLDTPGASLDDIIAENWQIDEQDCSECGEACWVDDNGVSHHTGVSTDRIDHDSDADHVAIPEPATESEMVLGWLEDLN